MEENKEIIDLTLTKNEGSLENKAARLLSAFSNIPTHILEAMRSYERLQNRMNETYSKIMPAMEAANKANEAMNRIALSYAPRIANALEVSGRVAVDMSERLSDSFERLIRVGQRQIEIIKISTPIVEWLRNIDYSSISESLNRALSALTDPKWHQRAREIYLRVLYESKWFPSVGLDSKVCLLFQINDIIMTSRGASKNREKRIDKAILSYYSDTEIKRIKKAWRNDNAIDYHTKRSLCQSLNAFLRGEYALTIPCLATMWEGLLWSKVNGNESYTIKGRSKQEENMCEIVNANHIDGIMSDFYCNMILAPCYGVDDVVEGVPNRHGIAHSWYTKYPSRKTALNAILLTDFILRLKPVEQMEATNVQA